MCFQKLEKLFVLQTCKNIKIAVFCVCRIAILIKRQEKRADEIILFGSQKIKNGGREESCLIKQKILFQGMKIDIKSKATGWEVNQEIMLAIPGYLQG